MVYISYNIEDRTSALYLIQKLKQQGVEVWVDIEKLVAGDSLPEKSEDGLKNSSSIIICYGKNGLGNRQLIEINAALQIHKKNNSFRIIPLLLPGSNVSNLPSVIQVFSRIDFRESFENKTELENLYSAIEGNDFLPKLDNDKTIHEIKTHTKPKNKRAVSVALLHGDEILIVQRADSQKSGGGLWQLPGGKVDQNEIPIKAAQREIEEEVGILIEEEKINTITEIVDTWVINTSDDFITMGLYLCNVANKQTIIAKEFQNHKWVKLSELFSDKLLIYFGSTSRYLRIIRRYIYLHLSLKEISQKLLFPGQLNYLPSKLMHVSTETTQSIYLLLSLLGFLDDKSNFTASSTLSGNLIKTLSEWSTTESVIFEADGDMKWQEEIDKKGDSVEVEKYKAGLFDQHKSLLGLLSYRLSKVLSTRYVCDILLTGFNPINSKTYLLIRWDFLATKFQIPSKGLEELNSDMLSEQTPKYVVKERFTEKIVDMFDYKYLNKIERTSHVGAGSLGGSDGPLLRNYKVLLFDLLPKDEYNDILVEALNTINTDTFKYLNSESNLQDTVKRTLNFYLWIDIDVLNLRKNNIEGRKLQGYKEIVDEFGSNFIDKNRKSIILSDKIKLPLIGQGKAENTAEFDLIIKKYFS